MTAGIATLDEIHDAPEVASLATLDTVLEQATAVLIYAHPELESAEILRYVDNPEPAIWIADAMLETMRTLSRAIDRYRQAVAVRREWTTVPKHDRTEIPF